LKFCIAHQIDGRTRLRVGTRPADPVLLTAFVDRLAQQPGIETLDLRETTGSLVIEHPSMDAVQFAECVMRAGGEILDENVAVQSHDNLAVVREGMSNVDKMLTQLSAGGVDMRTLSFLILFTFGIVQLVRGQIMMPAFSFLWYAFELVKKDSDGPTGPSIND